MAHRHGADGGEVSPPTSPTGAQPDPAGPVLTGALLAGPFLPAASHQEEERH